MADKPHLNLIVTGHIDCTARVLKKRVLKKSSELTFELPRNLQKYVCKKGSIAIDGISLTVNNVEGYYHFETIHLGDMGEMMSIDKDGDGDFDLVPKDVKVFCCLSGGYDFVPNLYWENVTGRYVRRIND